MDLTSDNGNSKSEGDVPKCSAKIYIEGEMVQCLESKPICQYYMNYGGVFFCNHPLKFEIANRTIIDNKKK